MWKHLARIGNGPLSSGAGLRAALVGGTCALLAGCGGGQSNPLGTDVMDRESLAGWPSIAVASDGTTYVAEPFRGSVNIDPLGAGDLRTAPGSGTATVLWRTSVSGKRLWAKVLDDGGAGSISVSPRLQDAPLIVVGRSAITKVSAAGDVLWSTKCDATTCAAEFPVAVATSDGGAAVQAERRVARYGPDGALAWVSTITEEAVGLTGGAFYLSGVAEADDGSLVVDGSGAYYSSFILRLGSSGTLLGTRYAAKDLGGGPAALATVNYLAVGSDGAIFAFGWYQGTVDFGDGSTPLLRSAGSGSKDFAMKLRTDLALDRFVDMTVEGNPGPCAAASDGGVFRVEHRMSGQEGIGAEPHIMKLNSGARTEWSIQAGGSRTHIMDMKAGGGIVAVVETVTGDDSVPGVAGSLRDAIYVARYSSSLPEDPARQR